MDFALAPAFSARILARVGEGAWARRASPQKPAPGAAHRKAGVRALSNPWRNRDGLLARVRAPGGRLSLDQASALADAVIPDAVTASSAYQPAPICTCEVSGGASARAPHRLVIARHPSARAGTSRSTTSIPRTSWTSDCVAVLEAAQRGQNVCANYRRSSALTPQHFCSETSTRTFASTRRAMVRSRCISRVRVCWCGMRARRDGRCRVVGLAFLALWGP